MHWPPPNDWPFAAQSTRVLNKPHRWHVVSLHAAVPQGSLLFLHGAGGALHSWRHLAPLLAADYDLHMVDLPGHGYTNSPGGARCGVEAMATDVLSLSDTQAWKPTAIIAHSAGAAVALRVAHMMARRGPAPQVVGINAALAPFDGVAGWLFPMMAKLLALNPLIPALVTMGASPEKAQKLIEGTGSKLDSAGYALYARLLGDKAHVSGTLQMMARWNLTPLLRDLPDIAAKVCFFAGSEDRAVEPSVAEAAAARLPNARVEHLEGLGHLAHEEAPVRVHALLQDCLEMQAA